MEGMVMKKEYLMPAVDIVRLKLEGIVCESELFSTSKVEDVSIAEEFEW